MNAKFGGDGGQRPVLASDLDGTLIPLDKNEENKRDLEILADRLRQHSITLTFVTGRHLELVKNAIAEHRLPKPGWIICDVGTTIYRAEDNGLEEVADYQSHLDEIVAPFPIADLQESLSDIDGLRRQEPEKQGRFKLSYYADAARMDLLVSTISERLAQHDAPYSIIDSVDPFTGDGLIDLLPRDVSKAYALQWWTRHAGLANEGVVFAGDSGNDLAAFLAGYRAVVVANTDRAVARQVFDEHRKQGWANNRLCLAAAPATSGVLEGCRWFGLMDDDAEDFAGSTPASLGATPIRCNQTHFRVWAPRRKSLAVETSPDVQPHSHELVRDEDGYFRGTVSGIGPGDRYRYSLDARISRPDPASRFQPDGVHGESQVIHPGAFPWQDGDWRGVPKQDLIIYELHLGTFTEAGTFEAAIERLAELKELGVTAVEIMPVAQSPGRWNWGYDGVGLFAVRNTYGTPDDFRAFVDACHAEGIAVILDVVYNHLGPEGNYLADFGPYFSKRHHTPWGDAWDYDGPNAGPVRRFIVENARYWLREYHLDGLRLDAVHFMLDDSKRTILADVREAVSHFELEAQRHIHLIAEANVYDADLLASHLHDRPAETKTAYDAIWCDDIMHSIYSVAVPGVGLSHREYTGWDDLVEALRYGFIYTDVKQSKRATPDERPHARNTGKSYLSSLVVGLQNHDCVGNHPHGKRLHQLASIELQKAAAALVLLYPTIPLIFMGEESAADSPFHFFADFQDPRLRKAVDRGREREYPQHAWQGAISPTDERAFYNSKYLAHGDRSVLAWYQSLIRLRKQWQNQGLLEGHRLTVDHQPQTSVLSLRYDVPHGPDRFVLVRLQAANQETPSAQVQIEGEILLDSHGAACNGKSQTITLHSDRAIIGTGQVRL